MDRNIDDGPFLHGDGGYLLTRFGGDRECQRNHVIATRHSSEHPNDGMQTQRLLIQC